MEFLPRAATIDRIGGEEFMILLPGYDARQTWELMDCIRRLIASHKFRYKEQDLQITCSIGFAIFTEDTPIEDVVQDADDANYRAKKGGRNQTRGLSTRRLLGLPAQVVKLQSRRPPPSLDSHNPAGNTTARRDRSFLYEPDFPSEVSVPSPAPYELLVGQVVLWASFSTSNNTVSSARVQGPGGPANIELIDILAQLHDIEPEGLIHDPRLNTPTQHISLDDVARKLDWEVAAPVTPLFSLPSRVRLRGTRRLRSTPTRLRRPMEDKSSSCGRSRSR